MSDSLENDASQLAKRRLKEACRTKDTSIRMAWTITIGEAILVGIAALALVDYWLMLPVGIRSIAAGLLILLALVGAYRLIRFFRRPTQLKEAALDVEAARPELGCEISTAAEYLSGERQITREYETDLVAALEAEAADRLRQTQVPYERRLLRPAIVLALTVFASLGLLLATPGSWTALKRAALPFSKARYTQVTVTPGNLEIPVGRDLEITNLFTGRAPKDPQLHWQQSGASSWQTIRLSQRASDGAWVHSFKSVQADIKYRVTGNDAVSEIYELKAYVPPEVKDLKVKIEFPAYTRHEPATQSSGDITALRASKVQIQIDPSVKLAAAKLRFSTNGQEILLQPTPEGTWIGRFDVTKDSDYWIEIADEKGHRGGDDKPHHITALPDTAPKVELQDPSGDMRASATNKVPVKISVADDFGVEEIQLVFHKLGGAKQTVKAQRESAINGEVIATAELDLSALEVSDYDVVAFHAEAKDNNTLDGPGTGQSPVYFVEITNLQGGACKPKTPGQKLNLVDVQKQIVADTTALEADAALDKFTSLSARQRDAGDFAKTYLEGLTASSAPAQALNEMQAAVQEMTTAATHLGSRQRGQALPTEESALAHLYQVLKQLPELQEMPTQPKPPAPPSDKLAVVLEAIKQKKQPKPEAKAVEDALNQAQNLARAQAELNAAVRNTEQPAAQDQPTVQTNQSPSTASPDKGTPESKQAQLAKAERKDSKSDKPGNGQQKDPGKGKGKGKGQGKGKGDGKGEAQAQANAQGKGKDQGQGEGEGQNGEPNTAQAKPQESPQDTPKDPGQLAQQEQQLSKEAKELAEKLQRLAGKDKRLGHNPGQNANLAGHKMATASEELKQGKFGAAGVNGFQGELALREVVSQLEGIVHEKPELTDVANEEAPKEFEGLISEYFKKLSHAE